MAGYLRETDFVMVEEGFSTRDLLEELTLGASQATAVRVWGWGRDLGSHSRLGCPLGPSSASFHSFGIQSLLFAREGLILSANSWSLPQFCPSNLSYLRACFQSPSALRGPSACRLGQGGEGWDTMAGAARHCPSRGVLFWACGDSLVLVLKENRL